MTEAPQQTARRKLDHLALCTDEDVESRDQTTLLEEVRFFHEALPELAFDEIDTSTTLVGHTLRVPLMISGMTGGVDEAAAINRVLAQVADERGMAFGVGSQRAMLRDPAAIRSYRVRDVAPNVFLCANIGAVQARDMSTAAAADLVGAIDANALCVHLNPAQELIQPEGDRDFRGCVDAIARLVEELDCPVIAKETGAGMSPRTLALLKQAGVRTVDVSGAGGTTWTGVETLRAQGIARSVGETLWSWGTPTAVGIVAAQRAGMEVIASGGIRDGMDVAQAISLGGQVASCALPYLRAFRAGGLPAVRDAADTLIRTLQTIMLLTASRDVAALQAAPKIIGRRLQDRLNALPIG